ncbi:TPA: phage head closure protein [Burkholderia vietnamiensis]|nr:phage head closure protein [Burkholderia vietnamiensis]
MRIEALDPDAQDTYGQPKEAWVKVCEVWADIMGKSGSQVIRSGQPVGEVKTSIRVRYREGLHEGMVAVLLGQGGAKSQQFNVDAVSPDFASREHVDLICTAVDNGRR